MNSQSEVDNESSIEIPEEFLCPLTLEIMKDPVMTRHLYSFERGAIVEWLARGNDHCPLSRKPMGLRDIITNHKLRAQIQKWQRENEQDIFIVGNTDDCSRVLAFVSVDKTDETERTYEGDDDDHEIREVSAAPQSSSARPRTGRFLRSILRRGSRR